MPHHLYDQEFRLNGYRPATAEVGHDFADRISLCELSTLATHHTSDGRHTYLVLHDDSTIYGAPGESPLVALHLTRDLARRTFTFDSERLPLLALAQSWLIQRGCPDGAIDPPDTLGTQPADQTTTALERRLREAANHYVIAESCAGEGDPASETVVLLQAANPPRSHPFRLLVETVDLQAGTHRLREGAFETAEAALAWLDHRSTPLSATLPTTSHSVPAKPTGPAAAHGRTR